jgi:hypothetical protein
LFLSAGAQKLADRHTFNSLLDAAAFAVAKLDNPVQIARRIEAAMQQRPTRGHSLEGIPMVYLELFNGRKTLDEQMGDWGTEKRPIPISLFREDAKPPYKGASRSWRRSCDGCAVSFRSQGDDAIVVRHRQNVSVVQLGSG